MILSKLKEGDVDLDISFCVSHSEQHQEEDADHYDNTNYCYYCRI